MKKQIILCFMFFSLLIVPALALADTEPVGSVMFVKGVVTAGPRDGEVRILGKGKPLYETDILTTGAHSFIMIKMVDDSRITLRSDTVLALEKYSPVKGKEKAVLRLFKGGLRAITGFISKHNPRRGFLVKSTTAVLGIRGTEFDARLCEGDCAAEEKRMERTSGPPQSQVIGRVARLQGRLLAREKDKSTRQLLKGGPLYVGDVLKTGPKDFAVLVFRDGTRVTLLAESSFLVEKYNYKAGKDDNSFFRLIKGGLSVFTGLIAKRNRKAFGVGTPTAVVGIRGTGFDLKLVQKNKTTFSPQAEKAGMYAQVWQGSIETKNNAGTTEIKQNQIIFLAGMNAKPSFLKAVPDFMRFNPELRPDKIQVDMKNMFGTSERSEKPPGLYVTVYDGHVTLENEKGSIDLGKGEAGYSDPQQLEITRLPQQPLFHINDRFPSPKMFDRNIDNFSNLVIDDPGGAKKKKEFECEIR